MALTKVTYSMIEGAPVNVLDYGADSTGATDSTSAFQAAVNTGNIVYIPEGTYSISSLTPNTTTGYIKLIGDGDKSILTSSGTKTNYGITSGALTTTLQIEVDSVRFTNFNYCIYVAEAYAHNYTANINNCKFDTSQQGIGLRSGYLTSATINNCFFSDIVNTSSSAAAIMLGNLNTVDYTEGSYTVTNNTITNVNCSNSESHGIWCTGKYAYINNNVIDTIINGITGDGGEAIYTKLAEALIDGNYITDGGTGQGAITIKGGASSVGVVVRNNFISAVTADNQNGIYIGGKNSTIDNNQITGLDGSGGYGIYGVANNYDNVFVTNNKIINCSIPYGIYAETYGSNISFVGNKIKGITGNSGTAAYYGFGWIPKGNTYNVIVSENSIEQAVIASTGATFYDMYINAAYTNSLIHDSWAIANNTIVAALQSTKTVYGFVIASGNATVTTEGWVITGNTITGNPDYFYRELLVNKTRHIDEGNSWTGTVVTIVNDSSPTLEYGTRTFKTLNVSSTKSITSFDSGSGGIANGTKITLFIDDAYTKVVTGTGAGAIHLNGAVDLNPAGKATLSLMWDTDGWWEIGRAVF